MSTRANIIVKAGREKLIFYRHSDGYPEGTMPLLNQFIEKVKSGEIRDNITQSAGWLIELGRREMFQCFSDFSDGFPENYRWKVGFIEPTTSIHGDIEYLYTIDLDKKTIKTKKV